MSGRTALVTGSARGIGRAIARRLAADGFSVVIGDLNQAGAVETAALATEAGGRAIGTALDITSDDSVAAAIASAEAAFGPVEVIVNNAGWDEHHQFVETDEAFWDRVIEINYKGCLRTTHAVLPGMIERQWGSRHQHRLRRRTRRLVAGGGLCGCQGGRRRIHEDDRS